MSCIDDVIEVIKLIEEKDKMVVEFLLVFGWGVLYFKCGGNFEVDFKVLIIKIFFELYFMILFEEDGVVIVSKEMGENSYFYCCGF